MMEDIVITRDVDVQVDEPMTVDVRDVILESYAQILLTQDKALISNLVSKHCISVPIESLQNIIKTILNAHEVEVHLDEDINCCAGKANPIRKIEAIKRIDANAEIITDFKQVFNKEFNQFVNNYHLYLKYCIL